jgi:hypothetical protein
MKLAPSALIALLPAIISCMGELPPPPALQVTSPERGLHQNDTGQVVVEGRAEPGSDGSPVTKVMVNDVQAKLSSDGTFTATVDVPTGAMLLRTVAISAEGGRAIDARAVHVGQLQPVGARIERGIVATLSTDAFLRLSQTASEEINKLDVMALLAPFTMGNSAANLTLTITTLDIGNVNVVLAPVDGGLSINVEVEGLNVAARADYAGPAVPDGSTTIGVTADKIAIGGTLVVTPEGASFKTTVASPTFAQTALRLQASGLVGSVLSLLQNNLNGTLQGIISRAATSALDPLINKALGSLGGPKHIDVLGQMVSLDGSFSEVQFTSEGALATLNLQAAIGGGEASPGFISTPNGTPEMDLGYGLQVGLSDDLLNDMLSQVHALKVLDLELNKDFGLFDKAKIDLTLPPMISGNTEDGSVRLVLGDMIVSVTNDGSTLVRAALNASVDVKVERGNADNEIAITFGQVDAVVNLLDDAPAEITSGDLMGATDAGIAIQLDSLEQVFVTVPIPAVKGLQIDSLAVKGDSGYVVASAKLH